MSKEKELLNIARRAVDSATRKSDVSSLSIDTTQLPQAISQCTGLFVTLWKRTPHGEELRGCIGRHARRFDNLADDITELAIAAAMDDDRFPPVLPEEVDRLRLEISFLSPLKKVHTIEELNPHRYGISVRAGMRSATLLPNIEGINTIQEQLHAIHRKAGIRENEPMEISRFEVTKVEESP